MILPLFVMACTNTSTDPRPNFLWIIADDMSPDLHVYGVAEAYAPNLDRLASEGMTFTRAFTVAAQCAPSRAGAFTGMHASSIGAHHMRTSDRGYQAVPPGYVRFFTEYLRAAGYYCTGTFKNDYNFDVPPGAFDQDYGSWETCPKDKPFFDIINLDVMHESFTWINDLSGDNDPENIAVPPYYPDDEAVRRELTINQDNISRGDESIGSILEKLEQAGLADNTVVVFWGDHGRGLPRAKRWMYDSGIHVPLIIRWPGNLAAGSINDEMISIIDLAPTMLSVAGIPIPSYMEGRAFLGDQARPARDYVYATRDRSDDVEDMIRAVRDKQFKYIRNYRPELPYAQWYEYMERQVTMTELRRLHSLGELDPVQELFFRKTKPVEELFDTSADPYEVNNLSGLPEYQDVLLRMRMVHDTWVEKTGDMGFIPEEDMISDFSQTSTQTPVITRDELAYMDEALVRLDVPDGGSIYYRVNGGFWKIMGWKEELHLEPGAVVEANAWRIGVGYGDTLTFTVQEHPVVLPPSPGCPDWYYKEFDPDRTIDDLSLCLTPVAECSDNCSPRLADINIEIDGNTVDVSGTAKDHNDDLIAVEVLIDGEEVSVAGLNDWSARIENLTQGEHRITFQSIDAKSNKSLLLRSNVHIY